MKDELRQVVADELSAMKAAVGSHGIVVSLSLRSARIGQASGGRLVATPSVPYGLQLASSSPVPACFENEHCDVRPRPFC